MSEYKLTIVGQRDLSEVFSALDGNPNVTVKRHGVNGSDTMAWVSTSGSERDFVDGVLSQGYRVDPRISYFPL